MHPYMTSLSVHSAVQCLPARNLTEQAPQNGVRTGRPHKNPSATGCPRCEPENKKRKVSLSDGVHYFTLAETPVALCQPVTSAMQSTVVAQSSQTASTVPDRRAIKTALEHLAAKALNRADFIVLVNRFGYHEPLHSFPLSRLHPADCRALTEQACQQIVQRDGSFLAQLAPEAITCDLCIGAYKECGKAMFKWVPERLEKPFFAKVIEMSPSALFDIPAKKRTFAQRLAACCADNYLLTVLTCEERTVELVTEVCLRTGYGLEYLPFAKRRYDLCLKACQTSGKALKYVPFCHKNAVLCRAALSTYGQAYRWLPKELSQRDEWRLLACQQDGAALQWIAQNEHDQKLHKAACKSNPKALMFIKPQLITYELCELACSQGARYAGPYMPKHRLDETLRWRICLNASIVEQCAGFKPNAANFYEKMLSENYLCSLAWVPEQDRTPAHYLPACQNHGNDLQLVPEHKRTPQICLAACTNRGTALQWVPQQQRTAQICQIACEKDVLALQYARKGTIRLEWFVKALCNPSHSAHFILLHAKRLLSEADFQRLPARAFVGGNRPQMAMLSHAQVSDAQKRELIEWMLEPKRWPLPAPSKASDLCEIASPLKLTLENPELEHLAHTALKVAGHWLPPRYDAGQALLDEIDRAMSSASVERASDCEPLFQAQGERAGGRTLKIEQGTQAYHYKFQRQGESLQTLMQEGVIHTVREKHPELFGPLCSKLPGQTRFFKLYLDQLTFPLPTFGDPLAIEKDENDRDYVHVYRYVASTDYSVYAHKADPTWPADPYRKGEQGLLTACHDIGLFVARGLVPTSTLPAFHDSATGRQWMALHALLGYQDSTVHPGTFGAWNSVATEQCDFGYGGFRDVGDFEPFGKIESYIKKVDAKASLQVTEVEQCLCLLNAVCENLLAAQLIRVRLRQTGSDYHYKNTKAQQQTEAFIEQTLISFLKGMYGGPMDSTDNSDSTDSDRHFLCERLEFEAPAYKRWLARAAAEVLYWTAQQPDTESPNQPPFADNSPLYSHQDGYALHLNRTGRLDPELYPDAGTKQCPANPYPQFFHNRDGRLNLGQNNAVFPLTTLMCGLVRLSTGILTDDHSGTALSFA